MTSSLKIINIKLSKIVLLAAGYHNKLIKKIINVKVSESVLLAAGCWLLSDTITAE